MPWVPRASRHDQRGFEGAAAGGAGHPVTTHRLPKLHLAHDDTGKPPQTADVLGLEDPRLLPDDAKGAHMVSIRSGERHAQIGPDMVAPATNGSPMKRLSRVTWDRFKGAPI